MAEKTDEQINEENAATVNALGTYLDYVAPTEQFGSNALGRIAKIQPIVTQEDLVERGMIGQNGLLTPKGDLFKTLNENGFVNPDGTLSEKSTAYMMDEDDALRPENLNAYKIRKENKVGEKPMSWGDTFGSLGELLWDAGAGLGTMVKVGVQNITQQDPDDVIKNAKASGIVVDEAKARDMLQKQEEKLLNKSSVAATSFVENSIKAFSETGAMINLGATWALSLPSKMMGDDIKATEMVDLSRQSQDRLMKSNRDAAIGSTLDAVFQTATYIPEMARVKEEMPKAEFDKIIKQTGAAGQIFADPFEMGKIGTVMKLATKPIVSRLTLNAERVIGEASERAARLAEIGVEIADVERAKNMTQNAAELARRTADAARERFDLNGDQNLLRRANAAEDIFNRSTLKVGQFTDDGIRLADESAQLAAESQSLASRIPVASAQAFEATMKAGRELKAVPFKAFAATIEPVSRGLIALDDGLDSVSKKLGIGAAYNLMTSKVGQAVGYGAAIGMGPIPAAIGAAGSVLKSGPFLQRLADTSRIMGTEMAKAQSQIPFFQRVANNSTISPAHRSLAHLTDLATMGGFLPDIARRGVKGAALSFPADFAAQYMSEGGEINQNTFKQAFAESVLIGGSSVSLGGMFAGTKQRHKELSVGDEINFRNEITAPDQKRLFTSAPSGIRRAVGTFAAVFPSVNIEFTQEGGGFHDDNTIGIDLNSSNPLKYLLAHEVKHLLVHRNQMHTPIVAMMLGDGEAGGIMRSPDGTLNPEFEAFAKEYNNRQISSGRAPVSLGKIAEEFFVEAGVEDMARMSESGELGAIASRTEARRMVGRLFNSIFDKSTVLKDFHLRIGGLMDQGGKLVQGNGLLDPGITQTQEMRNMTRNMLKRAAGRSVGQFEPLGAAEVGNKGEGPGTNLPINPGDKAMIEKIGPVEFEMETVNGRRQVVRDKDGNPVPVDFNTQLMRSRTGALIQEAIGNRPSTYQSSPNEMRLNDEGIWEGYLPPDIIEYIKKKGSLNQEQIRMIEHVNSMIKNFKGDVALVINHPATSRNKKGKLNYKTLKATLRQVVPISWNLTKDGNLTLGLMSVTQLKSNIDARISSRLGQQLYQGNRAKLMVDIGKVMELHQQGKRTDAYFDAEYGAAKSQQFKNFVNSVFGLMSKKQGEANPIFSEENLRGNGVYKTYRADRISQATKMTGDRYPFQYDFVVQNMMPNGLPTLDDQGRPVAQNYMPNVAVVPERFTGSKTDADRRGKYVEPPNFFKKFNISSYERGGRFFDTETGKDLTGKGFGTGSIDVSTGKPSLFVDGEERLNLEGSRFKTNLFKQSAGWKWVSENPPSTSTIVSIEGKGKHVYALKANFENGVHLTRYSEKSSEPRLRPTAVGEMQTGNQVATISIRGREHPVYDSVGIVSKDQVNRLPEPVTTDISPEDVNPIQNRKEAERLFSDGKQLYAFNEMDGEAVPITSLEMLKSYPPDAIGWIDQVENNVNRLPEPTDARSKKKKESDKLKIRQTRKTLKDWAMTQESWKDWYKEHQETLDDFFGEYAELFQEILAVTSQASSVKANVGLALKAFGQLMRNEEFDGKLRGLDESGYLPAVIGNLNAIKNKTAVGGRKISNYKSANEGDTSKVVVDRHISRMLFGVDTPSAKQYAKAEKVLTEIANELGWEPTQVQAALWAQSIVMSGKKPESYGAYLKKLQSKGLTKKELLNGIKGNQLTRRTGEIAGSSYGIDPTSTERGRYSPAGEAIIGGDGEGGINRLPEPLQKAPGQWNPQPLKAAVEQAKAKGIPHTVTDDVLSKIKGKPIVVGMADLLGAGGKVRDITVTGGPGYPVMTFDPQDPAKITSVWVSQRQGIKTILENMVKTDAIWQDDAGHHWAIYAPHTMKQNAHKSNAQTPLVYISKLGKLAERGAISKDSVREISDNIRKNIPMAKGMPDLDDKKLGRYIEGAAFETRAAIMSELTTARARNLGAPAPESVLTETRDAQYNGVEENAITSLLLVDIDRMAQKDANGKWQLRTDLGAEQFGVDKHPSYDTSIPGRILAHFQNPIPFRIAAPEMLKTMRTASPTSRPDFLLTRMPAGKGIKFQTMTDQLAAQINDVQSIGMSVPQIRETVLAATGNWKKFSSGESLKGLKEFTLAIDRSPAKESLSKYELSSLQKMIKNGEMDVYQLGENDIWFGVKTVPGEKGKPANKDLVSVINNTGIPGMLGVIMAQALASGVNTLDASSVINAKSPEGLLPSLYSRYGWIETGRDAYDKKYLVERDPNDTLEQHEAKIDQKEAALKMFWEEQGWDGKSMPDIVYMAHKGKQNGITIGKHQESVATRDAEAIRSATDETSGEVRGTGLPEGRNEASVGGGTTGNNGAGDGAIPRGFDSVIKNLASASDLQVEAMGLTSAQVDKFLKMHGAPARQKSTNP